MTGGGDPRQLNSADQSVWAESRARTSTYNKDVGTGPTVCPHRLISCVLLAQNRLPYPPPFPVTIYLTLWIESREEKSTKNNNFFRSGRGSRRKPLKNPAARQAGCSRVACGGSQSQISHVTYCNQSHFRMSTHHSQSEFNPMITES